MDPQVRPLLALPANKPKISRVLSLPYNYSFPQIQQLLIYLHPSIQYFGLDFQSQPTEQNLAQMFKHKKKLKNFYTIKGSNEKQRRQFEFVSELQIEWMSWQLKLMIPIVEVGEKQTEKKDNVDKSALREFISDSLYLLDEEGRNISNVQELTLNQIRKCSFQMAIHNYADYLNQDRKVSQKKRKIFSGKVISGFFMSKNEKMGVGLMKQMVVKDITEAVYTMHKCGFPYREVRLIDGLIPVQNFMQNENKDDSFDNFVKKISKKKVSENVSAQKSGENDKRQEERGQQPEKSNLVPLLLALLVVVLVYFYAKSRGSTSELIENL